MAQGVLGKPLDLLLNIAVTLEPLLVFPGGSDGKEPACNAGDAGLIPGSGRSPGEGNGSHSSVLVWRISWTEEPGALRFTGLQSVGQD